MLQIVFDCFDRPDIVFNVFCAFIVSVEIERPPFLFYNLEVLTLAIEVYSMKTMSDFSRLVILLMTCFVSIALTGVVDCHVIHENKPLKPSLSVLSLSKNENHKSRRQVLHEVYGIMFSIQILSGNPTCCRAVEGGTTTAAPTPVLKRGQGGKPYAPVEFLLPATRCKVWIDHAYDVSTQLAAVEDKKMQVKLLEELHEVLSSRPTLFVGKQKPLGRRPYTISVANKDQFQKNREGLSIPNKVAAMYTEAGMKRGWNTQQYRESKREKESDIRAAFNYYSQQLEFGDSYLLTASKEDRKRMIRNDELPSLTSVISSDLDLRDLYRNQLLTAIEDLIAEVTYQVKLSNNENVDLEEIILLAKQTHTACNNWFDLIPKEDIQDALIAVSND